MTDGELLRRYARDHSEDCFAELVRRHINLIYSAALRQVNHDPHLAEEVLQSVFTDLARKAAKLAGHPSLTGWLYTSARFAATNLRRADHRRQLREQEALAMKSLLNTSEPAPDWDRIRPLLDEAMHTLSEPDRQAVLLRHFENRSYADIGACLGLSEDTARKRVERALEKLHGVLARQGVTGTTATMAGLLAAHAVGIAPAPLAARVARTALKGVATAGGVSVLVSQLFASAKTKLAAHPSLTGWLYTSARFAATNLRRADHRRQRREQAALAMNAVLNVSEPAPDWDRIRPLLDEAMHSLSEPDRQAVLLRHFENRSYADIGACLGLTEDTARKRVERALEKLHGVLARQGVTGTAATMAGLLAAHAVGIAPAPMAARVARAAEPGSAKNSSTASPPHLSKSAP